MCANLVSFERLNKVEDAFPVCELLVTLDHIGLLRQNKGLSKVFHVIFLAFVFVSGAVGE